MTDVKSQEYRINRRASYTSDALPFPIAFFVATFVCDLIYW